jgi:hypothetical protein
MNAWQEVGRLAFQVIKREDDDDFLLGMLIDMGKNWEDVRTNPQASFNQWSEKWHIYKEGKK